MCGTPPFPEEASHTLTSRPVTDVFPSSDVMDPGLYLDPSLPGLVMVGHITLLCRLYVSGSITSLQGEEN